jgi:hypothetical protein
MIDLSGVQHHPAVRDIVSILQNKTQNKDTSFFQVEVAYFLSKMAAAMRAVVVTKDRGDIPVNTYVIALAPSGYGKGHSINIMETLFLVGFHKRFTEQTMPVIAETNLHRLAKEVSDRSVGTTDEITEDDAFTKMMIRYTRKGAYRFSFDSGTMPAVKQLREKLILADCGSINFQMDELGLNLVDNLEVLKLYLELYDQGLVKDKLTKNTEENQRDDEMVGKTPTNMLLFGTPSKLFDGGQTEDLFFALLDTGYARRPLFGWGTLESEVEDDLSPAERAPKVYQNLINPKNNNLAAQWAAKFADLADPLKFGWKMTMDDDVSIKLIEYKLACEKTAFELPEHEEIRKAELSHRYFKALKLAGAYAFMDGSVEVEMDHLLQAVLLTEQSGEAFSRFMSRDRAYVRLAKFIANCEGEVNYADLDEQLPFFKRSQKGEMMTLAQAWGAKNNIIIKRRYVDGIEWFKGERLKETDLSQVSFSYSHHYAYHFKGMKVPWDQLHRVALAVQVDKDNNPVVDGDGVVQTYHWANHYFRQEHRAEENVIPGFNLIVLDVEKGATLNQVVEVMKEHKFFVYTTKRHRRDGNGDRFRLVLPIKYVLSFDADDYKEFMLNVCAWLPFDGIDEAANQRSRKWLSHPAHPPDGYHYYNEGELLCPLKFIPKTVRNDQFQTEYKAIENLNNLERWFAVKMVLGNRNNNMLKFAMALVDGGLKYIEVEKLVKQFNAKLHPSLSTSEIDSTIMKTVAKKYVARTP